MNNKIYEEIVEKAKSMEKIVEEDYSEIEELEKNPIVQKYLYLMDLKKDHDLADDGKFAIPYKLATEYAETIKETNNIWFMFCELSAERACELVDIDVPYGISNNEMVVIYRDIENVNRYNVISKKERESFEATHNIAYGNTEIEEPFGRYFDARRDFFDDCIKHTQDYAIQKVLKK